MSIVLENVAEQHGMVSTCTPSPVNSGLKIICIASLKGCYPKSTPIHHQLGVSAPCSSEQSIIKCMDEVHPPGYIAIPGYSISRTGTDQNDINIWFVHSGFRIYPNQSRGVKDNGSKCMHTSFKTHLSFCRGLCA